MPSFAELHNKKSFDKADSARKMNFTLDLSDLASMRSIREVAVQAEHILGDRSGIRHLDSEAISDLSLFEHQDVSVQMDMPPDLRDASVSPDKHSAIDVSVGFSIRKEDVSIGHENEAREASVQYSQPQQQEISVQYAPLYLDQTVHMTREEDSRGIQCVADNENVSVQYSAKPLFQHMSEELESEADLVLSLDSRNNE